MLLDFVAEHYPEHLAVFCGYKAGVQRADAARYMLLHHFGGVYADIDCECVAPFDEIMAEERIVLCREPATHSAEEIALRNLPYLIFNGTMASPKGHPFWRHLLAYLPHTKEAREVIDSTGPFLLTAAQLSFADQGAFTLHPNTLFTPADRDGGAGPTPDACSPTLSVHHWIGTWWIHGKRPSLLNRLRSGIYRTRHELTQGAQLDIGATQAAVDRAAIDRSPPLGHNIAILVPLRDVADQIGPFLAALQQLEHPKERIKLVFCEDDSTDASWERLTDAVLPLKGHYRDIVTLRKTAGTRPNWVQRWKCGLQRARHADNAAIRNHMIAHGLDASDDWVLWIDINLWSFPADVIGRMVATGRRIIVPNCTTTPGGSSFDLNSFVSVRGKQRDYRYYRAMRNGLLQPRARDDRRLHLGDFRHLDGVNLDGVGGAMLLVDAALHRGGLTFPETPYKFLIDTEGFAALARDLGIIPLGLPKVEVLRVPW